MIHLRYATVHYTDEGCVSTFNDLSNWAAHPHDTHHYAVIAHRCGYGDDLLTYCREHELAHHLWAQEMYNTPSPVLWMLAHGEAVNPALAAAEEIAAHALQRWLRANERPIVAGVDWDSLKQRALAVMETFG